MFFEYMPLFLEVHSRLFSWSNSSKDSSDVTKIKIKSPVIDNANKNILYNCKCLFGLYNFTNI